MTKKNLEEKNNISSPLEILMFNLVREHDIIASLPCHFSLQVAGCGCRLLSNTKGTGSGSTGEPRAATSLMTCLKEMGMIRT